MAVVVRRRRVLLFRAGLASAWLVCGSGLARGQAGRPIKLDVRAGAHAVKSGGETTVQVTLRDANNRAVAAPKDMTVQLSVVTPSGVQKRQLDIKAGTQSQQTQIQFSDPGFTEIRATQPELLEGGTVVNVRTSGPARGRIGLRRSPEGFPVGVVAVLPVQFVRSAQPKPAVTLKYSPQRKILADGKDAVTVHVFIDWPDGNTATDCHVRLFTALGQIAPELVLIKRDDDDGHAELTSNEIGMANVEFVDSTPAADVHGDRMLQVSFVPPITRLDLRASPPTISLFDQTDIIVQLMDSSGKPLQTDEPRKVSLSIDQGRAETSQAELTIPSGQSDARAQFFPMWRGTVHISGWTPSLSTANAEFVVLLPVWTLILSFGGGAVGGLIAFLTKRARKLWRIGVGLVTGPSLYWAIAFGILAVIPRGIVLNPFSIAVVSVVGGWIGTEVFAVILKRVMPAS